jgi:hypothetical protein
MSDDDKESFGMRINRESMEKHRRELANQVVEFQKCVTIPATSAFTSGSLRAAYDAGILAAQGGSREAVQRCIDVAREEHEREVVQRAAGAVEDVVAQRDTVLRELSEQSRLRGIAESTLEATWLPGVVRGWQQRADAAEAKLGQVRALIATEDYRSQWNTEAGWDAAHFICQRLTAILEPEPPK